MKKHAKSTRAAARVYQQKLRAQELQAHKARTKGKALYTDGDLKAVMLDILEDPQHNVLAAVRSFNSLYKEHDHHRIPRGTASDWWQKVKPYLSTKKNYLGELKQTRARAFIADNVRCDGDTGANMRVLSDAEENVLVSYISEMFDRGFGLTTEDMIELARNVQKKRGDEPTATKKWYNAFMSRHDDIRKKKTTNICRSRQEAASRENMEQHFQRLREFFSKMKTEGKVPENSSWFPNHATINMDEVSADCWCKPGNLHHKVSDVSQRACKFLLVSEFSIIVFFCILHFTLI